MWRQQDANWCSEEPTGRKSLRSKEEYELRLKFGDIAQILVDIRKGKGGLGGYRMGTSRKYKDWKA
jgi:hypothetical protein